MEHLKRRQLIRIPILAIVLGCWSVTLAQNLGEIGKGKAFDINGSLGIGCMLTNQSGISARRVPFSWYVNGSPTLKIYDVTFPFSFVWSEQDRNFSQPFNKYGASPYYKWITLHAGWRNVYYSDYTLSGATFLGGGFDLNPGKIRVGAIYGKFRNKTLVNEESRSRYSYLLPSYERWGLGVKIGFGKGPNYTDLIIFNAKDKMDSTVMRMADSARINPMENIAIGIKSNYTIAKNFDFNVDVAASAVTLDSRLTDPLASQIGNISFLKNLIHVNRSTVPYLAGTTSLGYSLRKMRLKLEYKRVDPEYQTLGSYYINNDVQQITFSPTFMMFKNKLILTGSYGLRTNNLLETNTNTTINKIGSAFLTFTPKPAFGVSLNYSNYGTDLTNSQTQLNDSILFSVINQSIGGNIRLTKSKTDKSRSLMLNVQYQNLNDNNIVTRKFTQSSNYSGNLSYNYGRGKKGVNAGFGVAYSNINTYANDFQLIGPSANYRKNFKKIKLNTSVSASFQKMFKQNTSNGSITNIGFVLGYNPHKKHMLGLNVNAVFNNTGRASIYAYNEQRLSLRYQYQL